jgi:flagellin-like protein
MHKKRKTNIGLIGLGALVILMILLMPKNPRSSRGLMGIGTLILLIAFVLVAAIASAVIVSSGGSLQQKALITSSEAKEGIASTLEILQIKGSDPSSSGTPHRVTRLTLVARLNAGSEVLHLNKTVLNMDTNSVTQSIAYAGNVSEGVFAAATNDYVVSYIQSGTYNEIDYVNLGDMIQLKFNVQGGLGENERVRVTILPRSGAINQIEFITPENMAQPSVVLWPS